MSNHIPDPFDVSPIVIKENSALFSPKDDKKKKMEDSEFRKTLNKQTKKPHQTEKGTQSIFDLSKEQSKSLPKDLEEKELTPPPSEFPSPADKQKPSKKTPFHSPETPSSKHSFQERRLNEIIEKNRESTLNKLPEKSFDQPPLTQEDSSPAENLVSKDAPPLVSEDPPKELNKTEQKPTQIAPKSTQAQISEKILTDSLEKPLPSKNQSTIPPQEDPLARQTTGKIPVSKEKLEQVSLSNPHPKESSKIEEKGEHLFIQKKEKTVSSNSPRDTTLKEPSSSPLFSIPNTPLEPSASSLQSRPELSQSSPLKVLAAQMIEQIEIMKKGDLTSTKVVLRSPPILEGATLTLETSAHAKNEFNISFDNLSNEGQTFLDQKIKENSLTEAMKETGYVVHIVTTSTKDTSFFQNPQQQSSQERQQQSKDQGNRSSQDQQNEEEGS